MATLIRHSVLAAGVAPKDAIHVATALALNIPVIETFDKKLILKGLLIDELAIRQPLPPNRAHLTMTKPKQFDKFKQMAKELECDESEKAFDEKLKKVVKEIGDKDESVG